MAGPGSPGETEVNMAVVALVGPGRESPVQAETLGESTGPPGLGTGSITVCGADLKMPPHPGGEPWWLHVDTTKTGPRALYDDAVDEPCPPCASSDFPKGTWTGLASNNTPLMPAESLLKAGCTPSDLGGSQKGVIGKQLWEMGKILGQSLRGSLSLCSQPTEGVEQGEKQSKASSTFPLPTRRELVAPLLLGEEAWAVDWVCAVCMGLNSLWGCSNAMAQDHGPEEGAAAVSAMQARLIQGLTKEVTRLRDIREVTETFDWKDFFRTRTIDYKGDEVKTAMPFRWENIRPALPREIGVARLVDICQQGCKHYVENFPSFLKPPCEWGPLRKSRVMVKDEDWFSVAQGLMEAGIFGVVPESEVFRVRSKLLLNGLFGVEKHEEAEGIPIYRLIMNLVPLNDLCQSMAGDIQTLPHWFGMSPFHIEPHENMVVSSEDLRCFFYTLSLPPCWYPFLCFNKPLPAALVPAELRGEVCYPCSKVLPMGFLNSVGIAQHVHRTLVLRSQQHNSIRNTERCEIRKDRVLPDGKTVWRVYLDNYDLLEKYPSETLLEEPGDVAPEVMALKEEYLAWGLPRHPGKAVSRQTVAEVQGAVVDGTRGLAYPKGQKLSKYITIAHQLMEENMATQRQMQVVCGGLVYFSTFRRQLLGGLNAVWAFIESFNVRGRHRLPIPKVVKLEIRRFLCLVPLCRMSFRMGLRSLITCSDASEHGGGVCASTGLTRFGEQVALGGAAVEMQANRGGRILSIGLFDGIGSLRVALDLLGCDVAGHISVEKDPGARRVVEHHFPGTLHYHDIVEVVEKDVISWSLTHGQVEMVLIGAGPPCQGVSGLNSQRKGALRDERSGLFTHIKRIQALVKKHFVWAQVQTLMESVASMDEVDKSVMSKSFGEDPWRCDAGTLTWCNRPRLYWLTWELEHNEDIVDPSKRELVLIGESPWEQSVQRGWTKVDPTQSFPTFTTSRPRSSRGHRPAGLQHCDEDTVQRWELDSHRFPPYQYLPRHCLVNKAGVLRLPNIAEREYMMGIPVGYTQMCLPKGQRKTTEYHDKRLTLVGNGWSVPVVVWLIGQLVGPRGLGPRLSPGQVMARLNLESNPYIQSRLMRPPLTLDQGVSGSSESTLADQLGRLVSTKGADIMLLSTPDEVQSHQRLRHTVNPKMWRWKVISGWRWTGRGEHINSLELRACLACLRWRLEHVQEHDCRILHLTDSLVCLHSMTRGRTSSRRLRRTLCRINSLLLAHNVVGLWGYVSTDLNPADRPSRWAVHTKFRHAKGRL